MDLNINLIFQIAGVGILVAILSTLLNQAGREEYSQLVTLAGVVIVFMLVLQILNELFISVRDIFGF